MLIIVSQVDYVDNVEVELSDMKMRKNTLSCGKIKEKKNREDNKQMKVRLWRGGGDLRYLSS